MIESRVKFEKELEEKLDNLIMNNEFSNIIFLCIGTSKIIGDAIGPIVGSKLKSIENGYIQIYGTLENNLNFNNTKEILENINSNYTKPCIITIDAALSNNNLGNIILGNGFIKIGKALEKCLCFYSDVNIKCVVGNYYNDKRKNIETLQEVAIEEVTKMTSVIANGIRNVLKKKYIYDNISISG